MRRYIYIYIERERQKDRERERAREKERKGTEGGRQGGIHTQRHRESWR